MVDLSQACVMIAQLLTTSKVDPIPCSSGFEIIIHELESLASDSIATEAEV